MNQQCLQCTTYSRKGAVGQEGQKGSRAVREGGALWKAGHLEGRALEEAGHLKGRALGKEVGKGGESFWKGGVLLERKDSSWRKSRSFRKQ